jgi:site-specific recombinase XerD
MSCGSAQPSGATRRGTFATRLLWEADTDLVTVATLLCPSSVATTAIYTRPGEADLVEAVEGLE